MRLVVSVLALIMLGVSAQAMPRAPSLADSNNVVHIMSHPTCNQMRQMHRMMTGRKMSMTCHQIMRVHRMMTGRNMATTCNQMKRMYRMMTGRTMPMTCSQIMRMHRKMMRA
jgi:hypothetical protein